MGSLKSHVGVHCNVNRGVLALCMVVMLVSGCTVPQFDGPSGTQPGSSSTTSPPPGAKAILRRVTAEGIEPPEVGYANFTDEGSGVVIRIVILPPAGLTIGQHGIHLHGVGSCNPAPDPDTRNAMAAAFAAGPHYNPAGQHHGNHAGDLGNIIIQSDGMAFLTVVRPTLSFQGDGAFFADGAVIVHANPDDGQTDPEGGAGTRVLCGVVEV